MYLGTSGMYSIGFRDSRSASPLSCSYVGTGIMLLSLGLYSTGLYSSGLYSGLASSGLRSSRVCITSVVLDGGSELEGTGLGEEYTLTDGSASDLLGIGGESDSSLKVIENCQ